MNVLVPRRLTHRARWFTRSGVWVLLSVAISGTTLAQGTFETDITKADLETLLNTPVEVWTASKAASGPRKRPRSSRR